MMPNEVESVVEAAGLEVELVDAWVDIILVVELVDESSVKSCAVDWHLQTFKQTKKQITTAKILFILTTLSQAVPKWIPQRLR